MVDSFRPAARPCRGHSLHRPDRPSCAMNGFLTNELLPRPGLARRTCRLVGRRHRRGWPPAPLRQFAALRVLRPGYPVEGKRAPPGIGIGVRATAPAVRGLCGVTDRRRGPEGGTMKGILLGLGCTLAVGSGGLLAQDAAPAARLGNPAATLGRPVQPTVRAQAPDITPAVGQEA